VGDYAVISRLGSTRKVEYLLKDRLGSVDAVANASGSVIETRGYDAFGKPRDGAWNDLTPARIASTTVTPKGFTQHEHLNQLELIHMNGRAYDYHLGRFTGVDPFIQFPLNSQSLNPYSYILNNPLSGTDPTGYATCSLEDNKACLEEGKNTIVDSQGNKIGIVTLGKNTVSFQANPLGILKSFASNGAGTLGDMANSPIWRAAAQNRLNAIGNATSRVLLPNAIPLQQRGEKGSPWDFITGFWNERNNAPSDALNFGINTGAPGILYAVLTGDNLVHMPRLESSNKQLLGAFTYDVLNLMGAALAPRAIEGKAPEAGTPSMRQPEAGKGAHQAAAEKMQAWSPGESASSKVPSSWGEGVPTKKGEGVRWTDPSNKGNGVRIDRGNPTRSQETQRVDHVIVRHNGQIIGRSGNPINGSIADNAVEAHIPLSEWQQWRSWSSP
jgi:RHS repeat-associated protein